MRKANIEGSIVNISSVRSMETVPQNYSYSSSKAALDHITRTMAIELADDKV